MKTRLGMYVAMVAVLNLTGASLFAGPPEKGGEPCQSWQCYAPKPKPKPVCFNVYCRYQKDEKDHSVRCTAAATFNHFVDGDGDEIWGNSGLKNNPAFQVECDNLALYDGPGHRYTDEVGTRIQGIPGPFPAIVLPVGSLTELRHYSKSFLELNDQTLPGSCYIYTGPALENE